MAKRVNYGLKEALKLKEERKRKRKELEDKGWITQRVYSGHWEPTVKEIVEETVEEVVEITIGEGLPIEPEWVESEDFIELEPEPITSKVQCPICRKLYMPQGFPRHFEACQKLDKYKKELEELEEKDGNGTND